MVDHDYRFVLGRMKLLGENASQGGRVGKRSQVDSWLVASYAIEVTYVGNHLVWMCGNKFHGFTRRHFERSPGAICSDGDIEAIVLSGCRSLSQCIELYVLPSTA